MKRCACIIAVLLLLCGAAIAEELSALEDFAKGYGVELDTDSLPSSIAEIPDSAEAALEWIGKQLRAPFTDAVLRIRHLLLPAAMLMIAQAAHTEGYGGIEVILRVTLLAGCLEFVLPVVEATRSCLTRAVDFSDTAAPILSAVLTGAGMTGSAAIMQPIAAMIGNLFERWYMNAGLRIVKCAACLTLADGMTASIDLSGIVRLMRKAVNWGAGLTTAIFAAILSLGGAYAAGSDSVLLRTVKYAVDSASSVIGSATDAWGSYISGMTAVRNVAGISGVTTVLAVCFAPIASIACSMLVINLLSAAMRLTDGGDFANVLERIAGVIQCMLLLCCSAIGIVILLIGASMGVGGVFL